MEAHAQTVQQRGGEKKTVLMLYSEKDDDYYIPEGWWENRQFNPDDVYNNPVDCTVTHWMPLPGAPDAPEKGEKA